MNNYFHEALEKFNVNPVEKQPYNRWIQDEMPISKVHTEELVALAYLNYKRRQVVRTRLSHLMSWDGRHRAGKSVTACTFSWLWDTSFSKDFENRIVTDPDDLIKIIKTAGNNYELNKQIGIAIIIDEAGNTLSSTEWYESWAKTINKTVQMFGYLCPQISFVAPVQDYVNSGLRKMFHSHYSMSRNNNEYSVCKPYDIYYNSITGKKYPKHPIVRIGGMKTKLNRIKIKGIPSEILERYQNLERIRKTKLLDENLSNALQKEDDMEKVDPQEIIKQIIEKYTFFLNKKGNGLDQNIIAYHFSLKGKKASYILRLAERELEDVFKKLENNKPKIDIDSDEDEDNIPKKRKKRREQVNISLEEFNKELGI